MNKIEIIKERVSIEEILDRYWSAPNREGRYKCVFHNGKDYNMLVKNDFAYCFVCNESGDSIKVVQNIFNISAKQAIAKIDDDFRLGLGKPLTAQEKRKYAEQQRKKERERKRKEEMEKFESECLATIAEKLRIADDYIREKSFKGEVGSEEMFAYADSPDFVLFKRATERKRWLEWLWNVITEDTKYMLDEDFVQCYGTDRVDILRKIYAKEILI